MKLFTITLVLAIGTTFGAAAQSAPNPKKEVKEEKKAIKKAEKERHDKKVEQTEGNLENEQQRESVDRKSGDKPDLPNDERGVIDDKQKVKDAKKAK